MDALYHFRILRNLKGDTDEFVEVRSPEWGPACGADFSFYSPSAVAAYSASNATLRTDSCTQRCWGTTKNRALITEDTLQTWVPPEFPSEKN